MIVVVGGGPAGLSAALSAANNGGKVLLIDGYARLGGQYWRNNEVNGVNHEVDSDLSKGMKLIAEINAHPNIEILSSAQVWSATPPETSGGPITLEVLVNGINSKASQIKSKYIILATGAYDRTLPFTGWEMPGVVTPGGAQSLLKGSGMVIGKRGIIAGSGPFLIPVALNLAEAGCEVVAIVESNSLFAWYRGIFAMVLNPSKIFQSFGYLSRLKLKEIPIYSKSDVIRVEGKEKVERVFVRNQRNGEVQEFDVDFLASGSGFTADLSLATILGCEVVMDGIDYSTYVKVGSDQQSTIPGIYVAGEATGIGGYELAQIEGVIAGASAARASQGKRKRNLWVEKWKRARLETFAKALRSIYKVRSDWSEHTSDETLLCRCEEVSKGAIKTAIVDFAATDPRTIKLLTRAGMGACQGRVCGRAVLEYISKCTGQEPSSADAIALNKRPITQPISLGELAKTPIKESGNLAI